MLLLLSSVGGQQLTLKTSLMLEVRKPILRHLKVNLSLGKLLSNSIDERLKAFLSLSILKVLLVKKSQVLRQGQFESGILLSPVPKFEVKELLVLIEHLHVERAFLHFGLLLVAVPPHLHAFALKPVLLLV